MISYLLENDNSCIDYDNTKSINRKTWTWLPHPIRDDRKNEIIFSVFRKKINLKSEDVISVKIPFDSVTLPFNFSIAYVWEWSLLISASKGELVDDWYF